MSPCVELCFWLWLKHDPVPPWMSKGCRGTSAHQWHKMEGEILLNHCFPQCLQRNSCCDVCSISSRPSPLPKAQQDCFSHVLSKMLSSAALAFITTTMYRQFNLLPNFILLYHFIQTRNWYCLGRRSLKDTNSP